MVTEEQKNKILEWLHEDAPIVVEFEKKDGTVREMKCTLHESFLPPMPEPDPDKPAKKKNPDIQVVWDIEKEAFRSFRWDTLLTAKKLNYTIVAGGFEELQRELSNGS